MDLCRWFISTDCSWSCPGLLGQVSQHVGVYRNQLLPYSHINVERRGRQQMKITLGYFPTSFHKATDSTGDAALCRCSKSKLIYKFLLLMIRDLDNIILKVYKFEMETSFNLLVACFLFSYEAHLPGTKFLTTVLNRNQNKRNCRIFIAKTERFSIKTTDITRTYRSSLLLRRYRRVRDLSKPED